MTDNIKTRQAGTLAFDNRPRYDVEEMKSPAHKKCGFRDTSFVKQVEDTSFYRCNRCDQLFSIKDKIEVYHR